MDGRKMAIMPFKLWEDMKRWKEEQIQKPRLPPNPNVSATASLQRDLSSVMANEDLSEAEKSQLYGQTLHKFKTAHQKALKETSLFSPSDPSSSKMNQLVIDSVPSTMKRKAQLLVSLLKITQMCPGKMMVQSNFMANLFQGLILLIWSMMSLDIEKAVNLQVGKRLQKV